MFHGAARRAPSTTANAGRDHYHRTGPSTAPRTVGSVDPLTLGAHGGGERADRYERMLMENRKLKEERNEQDQRLRDLTTKFRRLTRDLKHAGIDIPLDGAMTADEAAADFAVAALTRENHDLKDQLRHAVAERDAALTRVAALETAMQRQHGSVIDVSTFLRHKQLAPLPPGAAAAHAGTSAAGTPRAGADAAAVQRLEHALAEAQRRNEVLAAQVATLASAAHKSPTVSAFAPAVGGRPPTGPAPAGAAGATTPRGPTGHHHHPPPATGGTAAVDATTMAALRDEVVQLRTKVATEAAALEHARHEKEMLEVELRARKAMMDTLTAAQQMQLQQPHQQAQQGGILARGLPGAAAGAGKPTPGITGVPSAAPPVGLDAGMQLLAGSTLATGAHYGAGGGGGEGPAAQQAHHERMHAAHAELHELRQQVADQKLQAVTARQGGEIATAQADALRRQCESLIEQLHRATAEAGDARRRCVELEAERTTLQMRAGRVEELQAALGGKTEDLMRCEQELLRLVDQLQACTREAETQVRVEYSARLADIEAQREEADRLRRSREREVFQLNQDIADMRRRSDADKEELAVLQHEVQRLRMQNVELVEANHTRAVAFVQHASDAQVIQNAALLSAARRPSTDQSHQHHSTRGGVSAAAPGGAASANISRPAATAHPSPMPTGQATGVGGGVGTSMAPGYAVANTVDAIFSGAHAWDADWEANHMREHTATLQFDLDTATARVRELEAVVEKKQKLYTDAMEERDLLLAENLELRRRLSGIQTCFARRAADAVTKSAGMAALTVVVRSTRFTDPSAQQPGTYFISLEGLAGFDCGLSDTFAIAPSANSAEPLIASGLALTFRIAGIPFDTEQALQLLRDAQLELQWHRVEGAGSVVVATSHCDLMPCLAGCLEGGGRHKVAAQLTGAAGTNVGAAEVEVDVDDVALPMAVLPRLDVSAHPAARLGLTSALSRGVDEDALRTLLYAFRGVSALRVQILSCRGLPLHNDGTAPTPYIFYTAALPDERRRLPSDAASYPLVVVRDTAVHPRDRRATADPVFNVEPTDHPIANFTAGVADFVRHGTITFAAFDAGSQREEENIGVLTVPLADLLKHGPASTIVGTDAPLVGAGRISYALSWVVLA